MSYYKITYESNTIEGLKAIQGSLPAHGTSATVSTTFETTVSPPPQQHEENLDAFSDNMPPPSAVEAEALLDNPPPPKMADSSIMNVGSEGEILPPPIDQQNNAMERGESFVPPKQLPSKGPKTTKKRSK